MDLCKKLSITSIKFRFLSFEFFIIFIMYCDAFTGRDEPKCAMIVARVLLGHTAIQRKLDTSSHKANSAPCKKCFHTTSKSAPKFDSLIFEGKLFREYVVYEGCLAYPEYVVKYTRSNSSMITDVAVDHTSM